MTAPVWHGVHVATASLRRRLSVDYDAYAEHVRFLAEGGCHGVCALNGSLGEYQTLTDEERARVVRTARRGRARRLPRHAGRGRVRVPPSRGAGPSRRPRRGLVGACCSRRTPTAPTAAPVVAHYREDGQGGAAGVAYNNPIDTKVDLTPPLLAELHQEGLIVGVKEFTGDVRRAYEIAELAARAGRAGRVGRRAAGAGHRRRGRLDPPATRT
ncbi:hypothetical protein GCM10020220_091200 [Nonomuraea rubra]|uniref:dihydrodipicolinate synthase family protein n=1 Tax=Nonomuraea rubra TaxID=46180 RepID=UPI0031EDC59F